MSQAAAKIPKPSTLNPEAPDAQSNPEVVSHLRLLACNHVGACRSLGVPVIWLLILEVYIDYIGLPPYPPTLGGGWAGPQALGGPGPKPPEDPAHKPLSPGDKLGASCALNHQEPPPRLMRPGQVE